MQSQKCTRPGKILSCLNSFSTKAPPELVELRARRYQMGLDIFTGEELNEQDADNWAALQDKKREPSDCETE